MLKQRLTYLILLIGAAAFVLFYREYIAFLVFALVAALPMVLFLLLLLTAPFLTVRLSDTGRVTSKGHAAPVEIRIRNRSIFPVSSARLTLTMQNRFSGEIIRENFLFPISARDETTVQMEVLSEHCGVVGIRLKKLVLYDFLSVTSVWRKVQGNMEISILPDVYAIEAPSEASPADSGESCRYSALKAGDDPSQVFDYHEYRDGDKLKNINWKLSNRLDRLMVKEFSAPISSSIGIAVELFFPGEGDRLERLDSLLEGCSSVSGWLFLHEASHDILWYSPENGMERMPLEHGEDFFPALERLYHTDAGATYGLLNAMAGPNEMAGYVNLVYITAGLTKEMLPPLIALRERTRLTLLVALGEEEGLEEDILTVLNQSEIAFQILTPSTLEEKLRGFTL